MRIRGVLWDMDGVLVDNADLHYQSWYDALTQHGIPFSREVFATTFGRNNEETMQILLGAAADSPLADQIVSEKENRFRESIRGRIKPMQGVVNWLSRFEVKGLKQTVASSAPIENIDAILQELDIGDFFDTINCGTGLPSKPDPYLFLQSARSIGVEPNLCLVIEDSRVGIEAAKSAGMRCVAVAKSSLAGDLSLADVIVESLDALSEADLDRL